MRFISKSPIFENLTLVLNVAMQIINLSPNHRGFLLDESKFDGILCETEFMGNAMD